MSANSTSRSNGSRFDAPRPRAAGTANEGEDFHFGEWLADMWEGRYLILSCTLLFLALGALVAWRSVPVYQAEGLLQLHDKKPLTSDPAFAKMEGLFPSPSDAAAEVEILKSDLILGRTVKTLGLDISATPKLLPVIGAALARGKADAPRIQVESLQVPDFLMGKTFLVTLQADGTFRLTDPTGEPLATGRPGEALTGTLPEGGVVKLTIRSISGKPGQDFRLIQQPLAASIDELRKSFDAAPRGALSNVIGLTYKGTSPARCSAVLNTIMNQYLDYTFERKTGDVSKTRALLENEMGPLKEKLDAAESRLNAFRSRYGSVDLPKEAEALLAQSTNLSAQISALQQKKQEALRTYRENSDVVTTIDQQIKRLQEESAQVGGRVRSLPGTQQEVVRLSRDVQVNTELYTALLNNLQQLRIASAGEVGAVAVVDAATVNPDPVGPKPSVLVSFFSTFGALVGIGLTMFRQLMRRGIRDHRVIEAKLGIPVLVTIPHSQGQEKHSEIISKSRDSSDPLGDPGSGHGEGEVPLLAAQTPDDLAIESIRSLRTTLLFASKTKAKRTIMVTGPSPSVGKSFLCANLAVLLVQTNIRVLLVDADLRRGNLHRYFGIKIRLSGLSDVLTDRSEWKSMIQHTRFDGLDLMTTGIIPADASQLLLSKHFGKFLAEAAAVYDYIVLDAPPLLPVTDATIIGAAAGTVLLVARFGQHPLDELRVCQQRLEDHHIELTGCVFNDIVPMGLGYGYQDYRYAYHYKYR